MDDSDVAAMRGRLLSVVRLQYPDMLAEDGFVLLDPVSGDPYTDDRRHLVATCRSIANFALALEAEGPPWCREAVDHGLEFLREAHQVADGEGYHLVVDPSGEPLDATRSAYGHAFVLLAYARAVQAGVVDAEADLEATHELLDERFRDGAGLLRSDCDGTWTELEPYRGQNANMHACEAYVAAYEATGRETYLDRAAHIAEAITVELAVPTDGLLWEHYDADWNHDFAYNADEPRHQFRPPGYQPGHHAEWAKLLALLDRYGAPAPQVPAGADVADGWYARAVSLFDAAVDLGWTGDGFLYTVEASGDPIVADRYGWALAEAIGAAAALKERAHSRGNADAVDRFADIEAELLDSTDRYRGPAGLWYEKRLPPADGGDPVAPDPPGVEPDYHPLGAYFERWRSGKTMRDRP